MWILVCEPAPFASPESLDSVDSFDSLAMLAISLEVIIKFDQQEMEKLPQQKMEEKSPQQKMEEKLHQQEMEMVYLMMKWYHLDLSVQQASTFTITCAGRVDASEQSVLGSVIL